MAVCVWRNCYDRFVTATGQQKCPGWRINNKIIVFICWLGISSDIYVYCSRCFGTETAIRKCLDFGSQPAVADYHVPSSFQWIKLTKTNPISSFCILSVGPDAGKPRQQERLQGPETAAEWPVQAHDQPEAKRATHSNHSTWTEAATEDDLCLLVEWPRWGAAVVATHIALLKRWWWTLIICVDYYDFMLSKD